MIVESGFGLSPDLQNMLLRAVENLPETERLALGYWGDGGKTAQAMLAQVGCFSIRRTEAGLVAASLMVNGPNGARESVALTMPEFRGQGLDRQGLSEIMGMCDRARCPGIRMLEIGAASRAGERLAQEFGFQRVPRSEGVFRRMRPGSR